MNLAHKRHHTDVGDPHKKVMEEMSVYKEHIEVDINKGKTPGEETVKTAVVVYKIWPTNSQVYILNGDLIFYQVPMLRP